MAEYESVLLVKSEVFVYKIPPRTTNRGYRANDWSLDNPDWTGRLRLVTKGSSCFIKLEDNSGALFAQCPVETFPGNAVESVSDSSRYFVFRIQDDNGRNAFIGVGFADRSDSFDFNVALQDHFKWVRKEEDILKEKDKPEKPLLDLGFKEGQTIKINMRIAKKDGESSSSRPKPKVGTGGGFGILPPPPGGIKIAPPPSALPRSSETTPQSSPAHLLFQQQSPASASPSSTQSASATNANPNDDWIQF